MKFRGLSMRLYAELFGLLGLGAILTIAHPAAAQLQPGDPHRIYPGANLVTRPRPIPQPRFRADGRVLAGGYGGSAVIVNSYPCYVPSYYVGYGGVYGYQNNYTAGFAIGANLGGVSLGYQQGFGYNNYQYVPPAVSYPPPASYQPADNGQVYNNGYPQADSAPFRAQPRQRTAEPADDAGDYYLNRKPSPAKAEPGLAQAVSDIETAFRTGNIALIEKHLDASKQLTLMAMGRSRRQLPVSDYVAMTKDAFQSIKTTHYDLANIEPGSNGTWLAYGKHILRAEGDADQTYNVGFVLKKNDDRWIITEVSADPAK